jgi:hypothetical protein
MKADRGARSEPVALDQRRQLRERLSPEIGLKAFGAKEVPGIEECLMRQIRSDLVGMRDSGTRIQE